MSRMDVFDILNFAIVIAGITVSVLGLILSLRVQHMEKKSKQFFFLVFLLLFLYTSSDLLSQISLVFLGEYFALLSKIAVFLESLFSSILLPLITAYMLYLSGQRPIRKEKLLFLSSLLWTVYAVMLIVNLFTGVFYYITAGNEYHRSPIYPVLLIPTVLLMVCNLIGLLLRKDQLSKKQFHAFLAYLLIPALGMILQMLFYGILFIALSTSASAFIMFIYVLNDQAEKEMDHIIRLNEQQLRIQTLQMRPHFIYNTLSNIYYLCDIDPKKAQKVINDFTTYLRKNFSAVVKKGLIPFEDELEHTKAYLSVAKTRYESFLQVEYDTGYTAFHIPPLTVEPIVENAVKHGLDPESGVLLIRISTAQTEDGSFITVENSGSELDASDLDFSNFGEEDPHIGLNNVSSRLKDLCDGSLEISPREGGGAVVVLYIPRRRS